MRQIRTLFTKIKTRFRPDNTYTESLGTATPADISTRHYLKHTTILFSLSDHYILSRGCRVIVHQVQTIYHGRHVWYNNQSGATELLIIRIFIFVWCVLSQLKPSGFYILSFEKAKNVELLMSLSYTEALVWRLRRDMVTCGEISRDLAVCILDILLILYIHIYVYL